MRKTYLLEYKSPKFLTLADWIDYEISLKVVWFWGLFSSYKKINYRIYDYQNSDNFFNHWDNLITNHIPLDSNYLLKTNNNN
jgi:hypothetical protein